MEFTFDTTFMNSILDTVKNAECSPSGLPLFTDMYERYQKLLDHDDNPVQCLYWYGLGSGFVVQSQHPVDNLLERYTKQADDNGVPEQSSSERVSAWLNYVLPSKICDDIVDRLVACRQREHIQDVIIDIWTCYAHATRLVPKHSKLSKHEKSLDAFCTGYFTGMHVVHKVALAKLCLSVKNSGNAN